MLDKANKPTWDNGFINYLFSDIKMQKNLKLIISKWISAAYIW